MPTPEELKFGEIAVEKGFLTRAQLDEVVDIQKKIGEMGINKNLNEVLLDKKYLTKDQIQVIRRSGGKISKDLGDFELLAKIGEGGMGAVYKARQKHMDRIVALKILPPRLAKSKDFIERFYREARSAARLNHVNIVSAIDSGEIEGFYYFAMEYVEGKNLHQIIKEKKLIPEKDALHYIIQIARALQHAHQNNLIHRDIKPHNILITQDGIAKLTDLGLAKSTGGDDISLTQTGMAVGTPDYISPEQARGEKDIDIRSDIYSLGATLYHMVTGEPPFPGSTAAVVMTKHITEEMPSPLEKNPNISQSICRVIEKMMAKKREDRYQTPQELTEDLELVMDGKTPFSATLESGKSAVRRVSPGIKERIASLRPKRLASAKKNPAFLLGAVIFVIVAIGAALILITKRPSPEPERETKLPSEETTKSPEPQPKPEPKPMVKLPEPSPKISPEQEERAEELFKETTVLIEKEDWFTAKGYLNELFADDLKDTKFVKANYQDIITKLDLSNKSADEVIKRITQLDNESGEHANNQRWKEAQQTGKEEDDIFEKYWHYFQAEPDYRDWRDNLKSHLRQYEKEIAVTDELTKADALYTNQKWIEAKELYLKIKSSYAETKTAQANDVQALIDKRIKEVGFRISVDTLLDEANRKMKNKDWFSAREIFTEVKNRLSNSAAATPKEAEQLKETEASITTCKQEIDKLTSMYKNELVKIQEDFDRNISKLSPEKDKLKYITFINKLKVFKKDYFPVLPPEAKEEIDSKLMACLTPYGQEKILFTSGTVGESNNDIYLINPDGSKQVRLTNHPASDSLPNISPSGTEITFTSNRDKGYQIYKMEIGGREATQLTDTANNYVSVWSPDGKWIFFTSDREGKGTRKIYKMKPDGSSQQKLFSTNFKPNSISISPDGRKLAFDDLEKKQIYVSSLDGLNIQSLNANQPGKYWYPTWSPDGKYVICRGRKNEDKNFHVYQVDVSTRKWSCLTDDNETDSLFPVYSSDGKWLYVGERRKLSKIKTTSLKNIRPINESMNFTPAYLCAGKMPYKIGIIVGPLSQTDADYSDKTGVFESLKDSLSLFAVFADTATKDDKVLRDNLKTVAFDDAVRSISELNQDILADTLIMSHTYILTADMITITDFVNQGGNLIMVGCIGAEMSAQNQSWRRWAQSLLGISNPNTPPVKISANETETILIQPQPDKKGHPLFTMLDEKLSELSNGRESTSLISWDYRNLATREGIIAEIKWTSKKNEQRTIPAILERTYGKGRVIHFNWDLDKKESELLLPAAIEYLRSLR